MLSLPSALTCVIRSALRSPVCSRSQRTPTPTCAPPSATILVHRSPVGRCITRSHSYEAVPAHGCHRRVGRHFCVHVAKCPAPGVGPSGGRAGRWQRIGGGRRATRTALSVTRG